MGTGVKNEKICGRGVFGFDIPEEFGGLGFDDQHMRKAAAVEMGRSSAGGVMASVGSRSIMLKPLTDLANDAIRQRALPELLSGRKGGALGITEPGGGSDVANMKTVAHRDGNDGCGDGDPGSAGLFCLSKALVVVWPEQGPGPWPHIRLHD